MKRSVLRLLTSAYIMLISVLLIVISAYAWVTISSSPEMDNVPVDMAGRDMIGLPDKAYSIWDGFTVTEPQDNGAGVYLITNAAEFVYAIRQAETATDTETLTMSIEADISLADMPWDSVMIDGSTGPKNVIIFGNDKEVVCLRSPLFEGGTGADASLYISDLTIAYSDITETASAGAFMKSAEGMGEVELENCHLLYSNVTGAHTGGLIGTTAGSSEKGNSVDTYITITDCTVDQCELKSTGTVGGIIGLAGSDPNTYQTIQNCSVNNSMLISTNPTYMGVGSILGTANLGDAYVIDCTSKDTVEIVANGLENENLSNLVYGKLDFGETGKLVITENGVTKVLGNEDLTFTVRTPEELQHALSYASDPDYLMDLTVIIANDLDMTGIEWTPVLLATAESEAAVTIRGGNNRITGLSAPLFAGGVRNQQGLETLVIQDLTIADSQITSTNTLGTGAFIENVAGLLSTTLSNCHLDNVEVTGATWTNAKGELEGARTGGMIGWTSSGKDTSDTAVESTVTVENCTVSNGSKIVGYGTVGGIIGHAGYHASVSHTVQNCDVSNTTLHSTEPPYKGIGTMVGTANIGQVYITDCTASGNTEKVADPLYESLNVPDLEYGRLVLNTKGLAVVTRGEDVAEFGPGYANFTVATEEGLREAFRYVSDTTYTGNITITLINDIVLTDIWTPVLPATAGLTDSLTIDGGGHSISALSAPLLEGGVRAQASQRTLEIRNLTLKDSPYMNSSNTLGAGAFIECVAGMEKVTLTNCHLDNVKLTSDTWVNEDGVIEGPRSGGFIGWTSSARDAEKKTMETRITVTDCTMSGGSSVIGHGSVGGIIGHAGYNNDTYHDIVNCTVSDSTLHSTESPYKGVGPIVGTVNVGKVNITNCRASNVTEIVPADCADSNATNLLYGRCVVGKYGELVIDGVVIATGTANVAATSETPVQGTTQQGNSVQDTPAQETPVEDTPAQETPVEDTPALETPVEDTPVLETPVEDTPALETPVEDTPVLETPVEDTPVLETPVEDTPALETPVEDTPALETSVEDTPALETPVEDTPVPETPVEDTPAQETPVEDTPVNETSENTTKETTPAESSFVEAETPTTSVA